METTCEPYIESNDLLVVYKRHTFSLYIVRPARTAVIPDRD